MAHAYDFSEGGGHLMRSRLLQFIRGINGPRENAVSRKQICDYFFNTPDPFIDSWIDKLLGSDHLMIVRTSGNRKRTSYVYVLTDRGQQLFEDYVRDGACHTGY